MPSWAVTRTEMVLAPTASASDPDGEPDVTDAYEPVSTLAWIVALAWLAVGVTVIELVAFKTDAVYEVVPLANVGSSVPLEIVKEESVASVESGAAARVTVTV